MHSSLGVFIVIFAFCTSGLHGDNIHDSPYHSAADAGTTERSRASMLCMDIKPQHSLDTEQIMGLWYGNEIIMHTQDFPGVFQYNSCVIIHLSDVTEQMQPRDYNININTNTNTNTNNNNNNYRRTSTYTPASQYNPHQHQLHRNDAQLQTKYLRLVWSEKDEKLEYTFNYTDRQPGLWMNIGEQRVTLMTRNRYNQFTGSVQVVKAVHDHLVLTFCGNDVKSSIYTIVLGRVSQGLSSEEIRSIRNLLSRRGLYTESVRKVCASAAMSGPTASFLLLLTLLGVIASIGKRN